MAEVKKRFTELPNEATTVTDDLYTAVDSATNGTMKFRLSRITEKIGDLAGLDTTDKSNLVAAINEVASSGGGGTGLSDDVKQALLQIAQKVAYVDAHGQDYYDDLYNAFYPPLTIVSISAVYTQSGDVYDTDSLDSLKADLVVTALYEDGTTQVVTNYTLSGTLAVGTSTITVSYGGKTDTFDVTVISNMLFNWDLTQSLVDSVSGREIELRGTNGAKPTQSSAGLVFNAATQNANFGSLSLVGKTLEIDVASFQFAGNTANHIRFVMHPPSAAAGGYGSLLYRSNSGWQAYGKSSGSTGNTWSGSYSGLSGNTDAVRNIFSGKTVKIIFGSESECIEIYLDDELKGSVTNIDISAYSGLVIGGGYQGWSEGNGDQCYNMTITGVRVYDNEVA